jgi:hypothetical protein
VTVRWKEHGWVGKPKLKGGEKENKTGKVPSEKSRKPNGCHFSEAKRRVS